VNISGILVITTPTAYSEVIRELGELEGIEVHFMQPETCRIVITQEAAQIGDEIAHLRRIKEIPGVTLAEMSYHYVGEDTDLTPIPRDAAEMEAVTGIRSNAVPEFLNQ
jgi:nitrate reductase NapAB chaperone NapD